MLQGIPSVTHDPKNEMYEGYSYQLEEHFFKVGHLQENEFGAGHIYYSPQWARLLERLNFKQIFIYRDPRDIVVSFAYFITEKYPFHPLSTYFSKELTSYKQRYLVLINGLSNSKLTYPNINEWYRQYLGWLDHPQTYSLSFEALIQSSQSRRKELEQLLHFLWQGSHPPIAYQKMIELMESKMDPKNSLTFRSGRSGSWRDEFDDEVKAAFKKQTGNLLITLGYESNEEW